MSHFGIKQVEVALPNAHFGQANWADAYETIAPGRCLSAPEAVEKMFGEKPPAWIRLLNGTRNRIVGLIGLKTGQISVDNGQAGAFPVISQSDDAVVVGFDDWHLNFRVVVETRRAENGTAVALSTLVNRRHWFGYLYIFAITPFHKLIVRRLLSNLA